MFSLKCIQSLGQKIYIRKFCTLISFINKLLYIYIFYFLQVPLTHFPQARNIVLISEYVPIFLYHNPVFPVSLTYHTWVPHVRVHAHTCVCLSLKPHLFSTFVLPFPTFLMLIFIAAIVLVTYAPVSLKQHAGKNIHRRQHSRPASASFCICYNEQTIEPYCDKWRMQNPF